jgi:hypothetical protein
MSLTFGRRGHRQGQEGVGLTQESGKASVTPAAAKNGPRVVAYLSRTWRLVKTRLQWILERRSTESGLKSTGWRARNFCISRAGLLRCIREFCGPVDADSLAAVRRLPEFHPGPPKRAAQLHPQRVGTRHTVGRTGHTSGTRHKLAA